MRKHWEVTAIWCSGFPSSIYMWTVDSESFKEPLWNVPDSHGESLLLLKCFVFSSLFFPGAPDILCECWKIRGIFSVCFSISREVRTKRQSAFAVYSARVLQFASQKLFVQINKIKKGKKDLTRREDAASHLPVQEYTVYFSSPNSSQAWHVCSRSLINFSH